MRNGFKTTLQLRRTDICDLMIACTDAKQSSNGAEKWDRLYDELKRQLEELDKQLDEIEKF